MAFWLVILIFILRWLALVFLTLAAIVFLLTYGPVPTQPRRPRPKSGLTCDVPNPPDGLDDVELTIDHLDPNPVTGGWVTRSSIHIGTGAKGGDIRRIGFATLHIGGGLYVGEGGSGGDASAEGGAGGVGISPKWRLLLGWGGSRGFRGGKARANGGPGGAGGVPAGAIGIRAQSS